MAELAEGARLEIVCTSQAYRGFESLSLRHYKITNRNKAELKPDPRQQKSC